MNNQGASMETFDLGPALGTPYILESNAELSYEQATKLTESIRNTSKVLWVLISRAHSGKAWVALGYPSWESYVVAEFDISRSRSYQLLNQAKVIEEIEASLPEGTHIVISESEARDLRGVLDEVLPQIKAQTQGLSAEEASSVTRTILDSSRLTEKENAYAQINEAREPGDENLDYKSKEFTDFDFADDSDGPAPILKDLPERSSIPERYGSIDLLSNDLSPLPKVDHSKIRRDINAVHDIYSSLSALAEMPIENLDEILGLIPADKYAGIDDHLEKAIENLNDFANRWRIKREAQEENEE